MPSRPRPRGSVLPQLYVQGELVGGCDIVTEMARGDELKELLVSKLGPDYAAASAAALAKALPPAPAAPAAAPAGELCDLRPLPHQDGSASSTWLYIFHRALHLPPRLRPASSISWRAATE